MSLAGLRAARFMRVAITLIALAVHALIPAGFMAAAQERPGIAITVCHGDGLVQATLDLGDDTPVTTPDKSFTGLCAFAALAQATVATPQVAADAPSLRVAYVVAPAPSVSPDLQSAAAGPPLPPRGPPAHA